jgi:hypothetical protein
MPGVKSNGVDETTARLGGRIHESKRRELRGRPIRLSRLVRFIGGFTADELEGAAQTQIRSTLRICLDRLAMQSKLDINLGGAFTQLAVPPQVVGPFTVIDELLQPKQCGAGRDRCLQSGTTGFAHSPMRIPDRLDQHFTLELRL